MAFHFEFPKTKIEVQDVNSSSSFNQSLISRVEWVRKCIKSTREQTTCESMVYTRRIWRKSTGTFFRREELNLKRDFWAQPSDLMDSSRSTVVMRRHFHELASLFDDRWIADVGSRCDLIALRRRGFDFDSPLDFDLTIAM